jgi:hypothetical protein
MNKRYQKRWSEAVNQRSSLNYGFWSSLLVSFINCIVCSLNYASDHLFWYLLFIVLSFLLWFTASDHLFWYLLFIVLSVLWIMASDHLFWYLCSLYCLSYFDLRLLIISFGFFVLCIVCPTLIYGFWTSLLVSFFLCFVCPSLIYGWTKDTKRDDQKP